MKMTEKQFRVIIVGGGVAGLVLANALEQANIDYILLERRGDIAPKIGQSIAAESNGSRILDQLGILNEWKKHSQACEWWYERDTNGEVLLKTDNIKLGGATRLGYDFLFGPRSKYLETIYGHLSDKTRILTRKYVVHVDHLEDSVSVTCDDGTRYEGNILVGADGVRSKVRNEMWRLASDIEPSRVKHDRQALRAEYRAFFGISQAPQQLVLGDCDFGYDNGRSTLVFAGPNQQAYVFIFEHMGRTYIDKDIPRFSKDDIEQFVQKHNDIKIRPNLTIGDFWQTMGNHALVSLEEAVFKMWTWGRIACVGDSAHKMTPNIGAGGNAAIESAAALANTIKEIVDLSNGKTPPLSLVQHHLQQYQSERGRRAGMMVRSAGEVTRMQAGHSLYHKISAKAIRLYPGDFLADYLSEYFAGAALLSYLPIPKASLSGHQFFNPTQGWSQPSNTMTRIILSVPFLLSFYVAIKVMDISSVMPLLAATIDRGTFTWESGSYKIKTKFYGVEKVDGLWTIANVFFMPAIFDLDKTCQMQSLRLLLDFGIVIAIWAFESVRRANLLTFAQMPGLFTLLGQARGIGVISSIYYLLHYVSSPIEKFKSLDQRLGRANYAVTILPAMILVHYLPLMMSYYWPTFVIREQWLFFWQMFPMWLFITTSAISCFYHDTTKSDRFESPGRDLHIIEYTIKSLASISSVNRAYGLAISVFSGNFDSFLWPAMLPYEAKTMIDFTTSFLKYDEIFLFGNSLLWLAYLYWDLKGAGMLDIGWLQLILFASTSLVILGPGVTVGIGWLWRERILATKRHKNATGHDSGRIQE